MTRYLADEGFRREVVAGVLRHVEIDVVTVQQVGLSAEPDEKVLEYAAEHGRILWTHDFHTMLPAAWDRMGRGAHLPGIIYVPWTMAVGTAIDFLVLLSAARDEEMANTVVQLPLQ